MSSAPQRTLAGPAGPLTWRQLAAGLRHDAAIRGALTEAILEPGHEALFWETSPSSQQARDQPLSFVTLPSTTLAQLQPDPRPFARQLQGAQHAATFTNLSGDAVLVAPTQDPTGPGYPHLVAFLRHAPATQREALWIAVGAAIEDWWSTRPDPLWVSTSGLGVSWLHVRLDRRPKYYHHAPFRHPPAP